MASFRKSWQVQCRVIKALMIREMQTRYGRENIGFLWIMMEPLLFAGLVAFIWSMMKGSSEHGVEVIPFVVSGYIPLVLFRHAVNRSVQIFVANGSLLYHRQIRITDFIFTRFMLEMAGGMMAYTFIGIGLYAMGHFPLPADIGMLIVGWSIYCLFTLSLCFVIAPLSEVSETLEKLMPVTTYIMIPFSGTFTMVSWLPAEAQPYMLWSPWVDGMEMMRAGLFGDAVQTYYSFAIPLGASLVLMVIGLALCKKVRKILVIE